MISNKPVLLTHHLFFNTFASTGYSVLVHLNIIPVMSFK